MRNTKYEKIANRHSSKENRVQNALLAFLSGGVLGILAEGMIEGFVFFFDLKQKEASYLLTQPIIYSVVQNTHKKPKN